MSLHMPDVLYPLGARVAVKNNPPVPDMPGEIIGYGFFRRSDGLLPVVLVELDEPQWLEGRQAFVTVLSVHPSNIELEQK